MIEIDSIEKLFDECPKAVQLLNYNGPPVVESCLFEAPLVVNRLHKVTSSLSLKGRSLVVCTALYKKQSLREREKC